MILGDVHIYRLDYSEYHDISPAMDFENIESVF